MLDVEAGLAECAALEGDLAGALVLTDEAIDTATRIGHETALGDLESWPSHLRLAVNLMLEAGPAMAVVWGKDFRFLYNDRYAEIIQDKHPAALGRPGVGPALRAGAGA